MASVFLIRGRDAGMHYSIDRDRTVIGRDASCDITIADHEISRQHAAILRESQQYRLIDLNSSNGTYVNGHRVQECLLHSGDRMQFGRTLLVFNIKESEFYGNPKVEVDIVSEHRADDYRPDELSQIRRTLPSFDGRTPNVKNPVAAGKNAQSVPIDNASQEPITTTLQETLDRGHWEMMYRTVLAVSRTMDIDQLLEQILDLIFQWVACDRGCIMLSNETTHELQPVARRNRSDKKSTQRIEISKTILDYVVERREGVLTSNAGDDHRWQAGASIAGMGIREAICVPMQGRYGMVGAIYIDTSQSAGRFAESNGCLTFNEEHLKLMVAIGHQAALAVEDSFYYRGMVQAERLATMGQTIAILSHHIKNILQGIRGGSYLIEEGLKREQIPTIAKGWKIVEKNQERIASLVMDMLSFSKERQPKFAPVDLRELVDDCIELIQPQAQEGGIQIEWQRPQDPVIAMAEEEGIHRAVLNVLGNAVDALHEIENGRIAVSLSREPDQTAIEIADNGPGIPPEDLQRVFSLFESTKGSRGTGLGLPVSQKILREHHGDIQVSSAPGQGAIFRLVLPNSEELPTDGG